MNKKQKSTYLYRYLPMINHSEAIKILSMDGVELKKKTTILEVISQYRKMPFYRRNNESELPFDEPYRSLYLTDYLLRENKLWAASHDSLNDPFEGSCFYTSEFVEYIVKKKAAKDQHKLSPAESVEVKKQIENMTEKRGGVYSSNPLDIEELADKHGFICFCRNYNNRLMWADYAKGHFGICVRFKVSGELAHYVKDGDDANDSFKVVGYELLNKQRFVILLGKVRYKDKPLFTDFERDEYYTNWAADMIMKNPSLKQYVNSHILQLWDAVTTKDQQLNVEEEARLIFLGHQGQVEIKKLISPSHVEPMLTIDQVIFGLRFKSDKGNQIYNLINMSIPKGIERKFAQVKGASWDIEAH